MNVRDMIKQEKMIMKVGVFKARFCPSDILINNKMVPVNQ